MKVYPGKKYPVVGYSQEQQDVIWDFESFAIVDLSDNNWLPGFTQFADKSNKEPEGLFFFKFQREAELQDIDEKDICFLPVYFQMKNANIKKF